MLKIENVTRRFGNIHSPSTMSMLEIPQGQMVGIIGRSGAGKSTLLRMINRLVDPSEGSIFFDGHQCRAIEGLSICAIGSVTVP